MTPEDAIERVIDLWDRQLLTPAMFSVSDCCDAFTELRRVWMEMLKAKR